MDYVGIAFLVALENLIPPIPSEVSLPLSGFSVAQGALQFIGVLIAATVGSVVGALALYLIGQRVGEVRPRRFSERSSGIPFITGPVDTKYQVGMVHFSPVIVGDVLCASGGAPECRNPNVWRTIPPCSALRTR